MDRTPTEPMRLEELDDAALLGLFQRGVDAAFSELVRRYQKRAFWVAWSVVGDVEDARDVSQEAFVRVFRSCGRFDASKNFYTWFYRILVNLAIDHMRKKSAVRSIASEQLAETECPAPDPNGMLEASELGDEVGAVLDLLPEKYRLVLILRDLHGLSCKEIGPILRCSHATVRWRLHQGRKMFRRHWTISQRKQGVAER